MFAVQKIDKFKEFAVQKMRKFKDFAVKKIKFLSNISNLKNISN